MKTMKKLLSMLLAVMMIVSIIPVMSIDASAYYSVSRDDGTWLFPLSSGYYSQFSDWAGCPGNGSCPFCGYVHSSWTDGDHTGQPAGHNGIDVSAPTGTSVYAPAAGSVIGASYQDARGYIVMVKHDIGNGWAYYSYSQHLNSISVSVGQSVSAGTVIGTVGSSGGNYGAHLHFGIIMAPSNYTFSQVLNVDYNSSSVWLKSSGYTTGRILTNPKNGYGYAGVYNAGAAVDYHRGSVTYTFDKSKVSIGTNIATTGINLNATQVTMVIGDSKTVTATVLPSNATNKNVTWSSNNTSVATVSNGVIKAVGAGGATITAKTASGGYSKTVEVIVNESDIYPSNSLTYNGHYYELYLQHLTWEQARDFCEENAGHLVTITSSAENNAVKNLIAKAQSSASDYVGYFIGLSDSETQNDYKWVTGETYSYSNWAMGQPSNSNWVTSYERYQDYGIIMNDGLWDDANNFGNYAYNIGFICEYDEMGDAVIDELPEGANPDDYEIVTEYRSRDKQTTTSTASTMSGWTLYDSKTTYGAWGSVQSTSTKPTESETLQITGTWTQYHYYHYLNYYSGCYNIDSISYGTNYGKHTIDRNSALSAVSMADQGGKQAYGSQTCSCGFNFWFLSGTTTFYNYQTRSKSTTNYFYKWSAWSEWSETPITATSTKEVEKRTVYRLKDHDSTNSNVTGLYKIDGTWYYLKNGDIDYTFTGLVKHTNGVWYYVENGILDWSYSGLWKHNGTWYYVQKGQINWKFTGLVKHTNGIWYYVQGARVNWGYTGLVKHNTGSWFYVQKGQINFSKTGLVKHTNGVWYYVQNGKLNWNKTGLVKHTDGNWYYVQKGQINWNYTGLVKHTNGKWYYVQKGKLNWNYTGYVYYNGKKYKVVNGVKV